MNFWSTPTPDILIKKCTQETKYDGVNRYIVKTRFFDLGRRRDEKFLRHYLRFHYFTGAKAEKNVLTVWHHFAATYIDVAKYTTFEIL